jgi:hypothetical protein
VSSRPSWQYGTSPYEHQDVVFRHTRDELAWGFFLDMGCGKSKVFIDTASWQYCSGKINGILLLAPKGVYGNWSDLDSGQFITHLPKEILERSVIFKWRSNHATKKFQAELQDFLHTPDDDLAIFVMNCEALNSKVAVGAAVAFLKSRQVCMGVDEATFIKTPTAQVTQKVIRLGRGAVSRRALTGTPVTNSPLDVFSLYEFLDPKILGFNSFFAFRARYAILQRQQIGPRSITLIRGYQRQDELRERMERACVIMKKEDCLDLPSKVYEWRDVELSPNQKRAYEQMRLQSIADLGQEKVITAPLALTKLLRLHQITLGFLVHEDEFGIKTIHDLDPDGGPRVRELLSLVDEIGDDQKIIIWANYTNNINIVARKLRSLYEPNGVRERVVAVYDGSTSQEDRELFVKKFQDPKDPLRFFVGHTRTGGFGLTLTQSANTIYFSNNFSLETRMQSEDRNHRIGQARSVTYVVRHVRRSSVARHHRRKDRARSSAQEGRGRRAHRGRLEEISRTPAGTRLRCHSPLVYWALRCAYCYLGSPRR